MLLNRKQGADLYGSSPAQTLVPSSDGFSQYLSCFPGVSIASQGFFKEKK
ncbi:hypothetical protein M095_1483 [Parabacteroides distasonis str. 3999B T(B) 4]|nr:hypothetical protein M095_1483 [Parabacteroides distasonis str. 3999B T(B) 4]